MLVPIFGLLAKQFFPIEHWQCSVISFINFHFYEFSLQFGLENGILRSSKGSNNQRSLEFIKGRNDANTNARICVIVLFRNNSTFCGLSFLTRESK
jgi:hypothetical protein